MKLPRPPIRYDERFQQQQQAALERELQRCHKRNEDMEMGRTRLILSSPNGSRFALSVDNAGALTAVAL